MASRTLVLIRHAKSAEGSVDLDRTLAPRGRRDADAIGEWLVAAGIVPDRVVVSPAVRAQQTWEHAAARLSESPDPVLDERIYDNEFGALRDVVHDTPDDVQTLVLVGHNPSFGEFAYRIEDGDGDPDARQELLAGYPTSGVAVFDLAVGWAGVDTGTATLRSFAAPRG